MIEASALRNGLRSENGVTYRFATTTPGMQTLQPGKVLLMAGRALRKVTTVTRAGGDTIVETSAANLNEAIRTGTLGWSRKVDWGTVPGSAYQEAALDSGLHGQAYAAAWRGASDTGATGSLGFSGEVSGFDVKLKLTPTADGGLRFELSAGRSNMEVTATGSISAFQSDSKLVYNQGTDELFTANVRGLKGEANLQWHAIGVGSPYDNDTPSFTLPFSVHIPILVGPLPMALSVKSAIRLAPVLVSGSSSGGSFKASYDSDFGFRFDSPAPSPQAAVRDARAQLGDKATVTAGFQPVGFGWGWQFPRIELSLIGTGTFAALTFDTYMAGQFTPGTTLSSDIPPCQRADITLHAIALYKVALLGLTALSGQSTLWEKKFPFYKNDKPCTLSGSS